MTNFLTDPITTPTTPLLRRRGLHIMEEIKVFVADERHIKYVDTILDTIERAAKIRGTGIAKRSPEYVKQKMLERKAIIALDGDKFAGFCYIESWSNKQFVANSGLIVVDTYRGHGLAKRIKRKAFELSRERFPEAKIFGLTTGEAVMKITRSIRFVNRRPCLLERVRKLCELRHLATKQSTHVSLHRHALRSSRT